VLHVSDPFDMASAYIIRGDVKDYHSIRVTGNFSFNMQTII